MAIQRTLCVMLDMSRDGVMKVEEVKRYAKISKKLKNQLQRKENS